MYRFALEMTPEDIEAVATLLYVEMLEQGYTPCRGIPLSASRPRWRALRQPAEMATRIAGRRDLRHRAHTAAEFSTRTVVRWGGLTHAGQRRFICSVDQFAGLTAAEPARPPLPGANHRRRAAQPAGRDA